MTAPDRQSGFTLIEVLIGATLLAVMMALLATALFTMTRTARAGEARLDQLDATQLVHGFLARQLAGTVPLTERTDGDEHVLFEGHDERLRFVGHLPAAQGGGLQFAEIAVVTRGASSTLVMRYTDAWPETRFGDVNAAWTTRALLPNIRRIRYSYFGNPTDEAPAEWHADWLERDRLPELIRVELEPVKGTATTLVAEVRVRTAVAQAALFRDVPGRPR